MCCNITLTKYTCKRCVLHKLKIQLFSWIIAHVMWCNITPTKCNYKKVQNTQTNTITQFDNSVCNMV